MTQMLYTKYRPLSLSDILDQEVVVTTLLNSIKKDNIAHAYLFSGSRGTGKTSIARAFAREMGIHQDDIYEVDAASNAGVDDIKQLMETLYTLPFHSNFKMYILDEVHMLSKAAFNAFLKSLEEPPQHVIFILATTDPHKLPETIISRCLQLTLKKPSLEVLQAQVVKIASVEGFELEVEASQIIALSGGGSYRDTLANLQKVLTFCNDKKITAEVTSKVLNVPGLKDVFLYLAALDGLESPEVGLNVLKNISQNGYNTSFFASQTLVFSRILLLIRFKVLGLESVSTEHGSYVAGEFKKLLDNKSPKINSKTLVALIDAELVGSRSGQPTLPFELLLL